MLEGYKTLIGLFLSFGAQAAKLSGHDLGDVGPLTDAINTSVADLVSLSGMVLALYGRIVAKTPVGGAK